MELVIFIYRVIRSQAGAAGMWLASSMNRGEGNPKAFLPAEKRQRHAGVVSLALFLILSQEKLLAHVILLDICRVV